LKTNPKKSAIGSLKYRSALMLHGNARKRRNTAKTFPGDISDQCRYMLNGAYAVTAKSTPVLAPLFCAKIRIGCSE